MEKHPIQPLYKDEHGVIRFKPNKIVQWLLDAGPHDLNDIARMNFDNDDRIQFAQLIGYSLSGAGDLSYFDDETYNAARCMYYDNKDEKDIRINYLQDKICDVKAICKDLQKILFDKD